MEVDFRAEILILSHVFQVFVGVNCLVLMHWSGLQGPDLRKLQAWAPGSLRDATSGVRTNPPEVQVQSGNVWVGVKGQG